VAPIRTVTNTDSEKANGFNILQFYEEDGFHSLLSTVKGDLMIIHLIDFSEFTNFGV
jgi:hypothetical protein